MKKGFKKVIAFLMCILLLLTTVWSDGIRLFAEGEEQTGGEPAEQAFSDIVTGSSISKTMDIKMTDSLKVILSFKLPDDTADWSLDDNYTYRYDINAIEAVKDGESQGRAALIAQTSTTEPLPVVMDGVKVGTYTIVNGVVHISFKDGLDYLRNSEISRVGTFEFQCGLREEAFDNQSGTYTLKFSTDTNVVNPTITTQDKDVVKGGVTIEKSAAVFDEDTKTARYTITVNNISGGVISNLVVSDSMGSYLSYDSIETAGITVDDSDLQNITFTMSSVPEGETSFTYTCKVSDGAFLNANSSNGSSKGLNNSITASIDNKPIYVDNNNKTKQDTSFSIKKDILTKKAAAAGDRRVKWTITINKGDTAFDLKGYTFSDSMEAGMDIDGSAISVTGDNQSVVMGLKDAIINKQDYSFPDGTTGEYVITYETEVTASAGVKSYTNTATVSNGTYTDTAKATSPKVGNAICSKTPGTPAVDENTGSATEGELIIPWTTVIDVPDYITTLSYKDYMNNWYGENGLGFVEEGGSVFTITGQDGNALSMGSDYTVSGSGLERTIQFTNDGIDKIKGKKINITYSTVGNYSSREYEDNNSKYTNRYILYYDSEKEEGSAQIDVPKNKPRTPDSFIEKVVDSVDKKNHTITWKITVKADEDTPISDLVLVDEIEDMSYWGYKGIKSDEAYVYIKDSSYMEYRYPMDVKDISSGGNTKYRFTVDFSNPSYQLDNIQVWGNPQDRLNKDSFTGEVSIYYTTRVAGNRLLYNNTSTYTNSVNATADINNVVVTDSDSASRELTVEVLSKNCEQNLSDGVNVLTYTIKVNPDGEKLNPDQNMNYYLVEDSMPSNQIWINDASKTILTNADTKEVLTRVDTADEVISAPAGSNVYHISYIDNMLTFTVPDAIPINITYKVTMLSDAAEGNKTYVNTVQLAKPYVSNKSYVENSQKRHVSSSSMTMVGTRLFETSKVDATNTTKYLSGAKFEAVEYVYDSASDVWALSGNVFEVTTDSTGRMWDEKYVPTGSSQPDSKIQKNNYYVIRETDAPYGYEISDQVYKVIVVDSQTIAVNALNKLPQDVYRITAGTELIFSDMPSRVLPENELIINKNYYMADGVTAATPASNALLQVFEGNLTLNQCESGKFTPFNTGVIEGNFTYQNADNKIILKEIPDGTYTVFEKSAPDGYDRLNRVYHFTVTDHKISWEGEPGEYKPDAIEIKNVQTFDNSIIINKRYFGAKDTEKNSPLTNIHKKAEFTCTMTHELDETGAYVPVSGVKNVMTTQDGFTYAIYKLSAGKYLIEESAADIYIPDVLLPLTVEISANGIVKIYDNNGSEISYNLGSNMLHRKLTLDNVIRDNSFVIRKTYYDKDGNIIEANTIPETGTGRQKVEFTLYKWKGSGDKLQKVNYVNTVSGTDYEVYKLDKAIVNGDYDQYVWNNIEPGYYMAEESLKSQDTSDYEALQSVYFYVDDEYRVHVNNEQTGSYDNMAAVVNREVDGAVCRFYLQKAIANQSGTGETLITTEPSDIGFTLTNTSNGQNIPFTFNSAKQRWEAVGLQAGEYTVEETAVREGYEPAEIISFEIGDRQDGSGIEIKNIKYGTEPVSEDTSDFRTSMVAEDGMETMVATLINRPVSNSLTLNKLYLQPGKTSLAVHNTNAEFVVFRVNGSSLTKVGTMSTLDGNTYTMEKFDPGEYVVKETYVPEGFTGAADISFTVSDDFKLTVNAPGAVSGLDATVQTDNVLSNRIRITKKYTYMNGTEVTDADRTDFLSETEFKLYDSQNREVSGKLSFTNGVIEVKDISQGAYTIRETGTPSGFSPAADISLVVGADGNISVAYQGTRSDFSSIYGNNSADVSATLYNRQLTNELTVQKQYYKPDGVTPIPLNSITQFAVFTISRTDNAEITGMNASVSQRNGKYIFSNLVPGEYKLTETAPEGFRPVSEIVFTVDKHGNIIWPSTSPAGWSLGGTNNSHNVSVKAYNSKLPNELKLKKNYYDEEGNEVVPDDSDPSNIAGFVLKDVSGNEYILIYDRTTTFYSVSNVPTGTYSLIETVPDGYKESGNITVTVYRDGTIDASFSGNNPGDFSITGGGTRENALIVYNNHQVSNKITIHKSYVSARGKNLDIASDLFAEEYADFRLYRDYGQSTQTEITGARVYKNKLNGTYTFFNLEPGAYTIVETPGTGFAGYRDITFTVLSDRTIAALSETALSGSDSYIKDISVENVRNVYDNSFTFTKLFVDENGNTVTDVGEYNNLIGATEFVVIDADNNEQALSYDAVNREYRLSNLEPGNYIIREKKCPDNYRRADDITLRVVKTGNGNSIIYADYNGLSQDIDIMNPATAAVSAALKNYSDAYVFISKRTMTGQSELAGAVLSITDTAGNIIIPEWVSGNTEYGIPLNSFERNKVYILKEVKTPFGYDYFNPIFFKIDDGGQISISDSAGGNYQQLSGNVIIARDEVKKLAIKKIDSETNTNLKGAGLVIKDDTNNVIAGEWTTGAADYEAELTDFEAGRVYSLVEIKAPDGYKIASPIKFKFDDYGDLYIYNEKTGAFDLTDNLVLVMTDEKEEVTEDDRNQTTENTTEDTTESNTEDTFDNQTGESHSKDNEPYTGDGGVIYILLFVGVCSLFGVIVSGKRIKK